MRNQVKQARQMSSPSGDDAERLLMTLQIAVQQDGPAALHSPALQRALKLLFSWAVMQATEMLARLGSPSPAHSAEDAAQDWLLVAPHTILRLHQGANAVPFLYGALRNICRTIARRTQRERALPDTFAPASAAKPPSHCFFQALAVQDVQACLKQLEPQEREAVAERYWRGTASADIAQIRGETANAVDMRLHRSRNKLRRELERCGYEMSRSRTASGSRQNRKVGMKEVPGKRQ